MRTVSGLFDRLCDPVLLLRAIDLTVWGKRRSPEGAWLFFRREQVALELAQALRAGTWWPLDFKPLLIRDPKPRVIARAPIEDRVVHTAVVELLWPAIARGLMDENFACRPGHGTHRAVQALARHVRRHRFCLHLDVRAFFPSVDPLRLLDLLRRWVRDDRFVAVLAAILEGGTRLYRDPELRAFMGLPADWPLPGRGLPIGALTSQILATHVYLGGLDHFVKRTLEVPGYVRYVDDFFLFSDGRAELRAWGRAVGAWLAEHRDLRLKHPDAPLVSCSGTLHGLGHAIRRSGVEPLPRARRRLALRLAQALADGGTRALGRSVAARLGVLL